ncbi:DUF2184 domain-containing protein [Pluralibacter gergoviae]|uniref:DUF2184 domain-containing protein n=1 Tax=Pluralibacter gergoviae TaxID=61647 RepID=A0AAI9DLJ4_PLUGE|nr:DUF2184 domain-containing protein [Pluralibacter gergoviae]EKV9907721.1 DUF2184 domain-containing protein [Pluralibacter gergoviae]EKW7276810.1 DUF2184 domain-containing protein [Pluralibacter gergoviae]ELD4293947.1 DUF2184 domain-containing protein [Pluralibacter gergoviae]ELD4304726.1 DUF2184 domain-containing protein [Pluralibacter gergoviae]
MPKSVFDMSPTAALSFLTQQAAHIEAELYRIEYPQLKYNSLVPLDNSAPDWTKVVMFRGIDARGELQVFGPNSTDVPTVEIAMTQGFHEVKTAALGYTYSIEEIGFAAMNNTNLDAEKGQAVRDVVEQGLNKIYLLGHDKLGEGLYTSPNVPVRSAPATLAALVSAIPTAGAQPVIDFFAAAYNGVYLDQTTTVHRPNTFALPAEQFQLLQRTLLDTKNASNLTLLEFLRTNFKDMTFEDDILLKELGAASSDRMVTYKKDIRVVKGHDVMPLQFLAPATADNVNFKVPAITRTGGTEWRIPKAANYTDGV